MLRIIVIQCYLSGAALRDPSEASPALFYPNNSTMVERVSRVDPE